MQSLECRFEKNKVICPPLHPNVSHLRARLLAPSSEQMAEYTRAPAQPFSSDRRRERVFKVYFEP